MEPWFNKLDARRKWPKILIHMYPSIPNKLAGIAKFQYNNNDSKIKLNDFLHAIIRSQHINIHKFEQWLPFHYLLADASPGIVER